MSADHNTLASSPDRRSLGRADTSQDFTSATTDKYYKLARTFSKATRDAINAEVPLGAWAAAAEASSKVPTLSEIRGGTYVESVWPGDPISPVEWRNDHRLLSVSLDRNEQSNDANSHGTSNNPRSGSINTALVQGPKIPWTKSILIGLRAFWKWFLTVPGILITIYALNVVAWGGMLFLLLCNAAPAMCWALDEHDGWIRDCDHLYSSRRIWMEIDSQILNALFCVTGFGLIPWRFRDLYYLLRWRMLSQDRVGFHQKVYGLRTLGGVYRNWVRLPGSDTLDTHSLEEYTILAFSSNSTHMSLSPSKHDFMLPSVKEHALDPRVPWKLWKTPPPPITGVRAPPTALWKIDFFIWCNVWNSLLQGCLCGVMWGLSRFNRPSWCTGLFIGLACVVSGAAGIMSFLESKKIRRIEGVMLEDE